MRELLRNASKELLQRLVLRESFAWRMRASEVALTFDDGPHPEFTARLLDVLAKHRVKATFFVVGEHVDRHPQLARRIVEEGHAIGGHSYDHTVITSQSAQALASDMMRCRESIRRAANVDSILFRPPKGEVSFSALMRLKRLGYRVIHWSRTYSDYRQDGTEALLGRMRQHAPNGGDILLFHDHNPFTVQALAAEIPVWQQRGLKFATL